MAAASAALIAFHAYLFGADVVRGAMGEPAVALRWGAAALVVAVLVALRRRGASLVGRRAATMWVLAALLHGPALAAPSSDTAGGSPDALAALLETTFAGACLLVLLVGAWRSPRSRRRLFSSRLQRPAVSASASRFDLTPRGPRPPPIALLAFRL